MRAAVIRESRQVDVMTLEDPAPGPREVVVQVAACGICGTDLHILEGEFAPSLPIVPGHEFAGVVVATGSDVGEIAVGQRVAVDPSLYCAIRGCDVLATRLGAHVLIYGSGTMGLMMLELAKRTGAAPGAADLFATGILDPDVFISDRLPLTGYAEALALFERGEGRKIQVLPLACSRLTDNSQRGSAGMTIREELSCVPLLC